MFGRLLVDNEEWLIEALWFGAGAIAATYKPRNRTAKLPPIGKTFFLAVCDELQRQGHMSFGDPVFESCACDIAYAFTMPGAKAEAMLHEFQTVSIAHVVFSRS